ncbi:hypothetical protein NMY22_g3790 [Coprinellus aureogranulatus]|nr:hypothetical protein NMY22_g3790 [Coprinellus aureogranulatus]
MLWASSRCSGTYGTHKHATSRLTRLHATREAWPRSFDLKCHANALRRFLTQGSSARSQDSTIRNERRPRIASPYWKPPPLPQPVFPRRTVLIKGWTSFRDMVEVFAVLRAVEEKYGTIVEYVVSKDFEMPEKPFAMIFAAFADPASFKLVPTTGVELAVPAPSYKPKPGGVGWDDIESLLSEADRDPDYDRKHSFPLGERAGQVQEHIFVRVSPAKREISSNPFPVDEPPSPEMQRQVAEKFLQWATENKPLRPIPSTRAITDRELFGSSELDNVRLRAAVRWVGAALGKRTPFETYSQTGEVLEDKREDALASDSIPTGDSKPSIEDTKPIEPSSDHHREETALESLAHTPQDSTAPADFKTKNGIHQVRERIYAGQGTSGVDMAGILEVEGDGLLVGTLDDDSEGFQPDALPKTPQPALTQISHV